MDDLLFFSVKSHWISFLPPLIISFFYYYSQNPAKNPAILIYPLLGILTVLFIKTRRRRLIETLGDRRPIHAITVTGTVTASPRNIKLMLKTGFAPDHPRSGSSSNRPFPLLQDLLSLEFNQRSLRNFAIDTANKDDRRTDPSPRTSCSRERHHRFSGRFGEIRLRQHLQGGSRQRCAHIDQTQPPQEELLRDNVTCFITAGRETTSSALTWLFWSMSSRPDVEKRILEEVKLTRPVTNRNNNRSFSVDQMGNMPYLHAVAKETLRLYPPVPIDTQWRRDGYVKSDGTFIGNDWATTYCAYEMKRWVKEWEDDPMEFRPERFLEGGVSRQECQYRLLPFHGGPTMCTGMEMVNIQMKSITASVLERFEISAAKKKKKNPQPLLSMTLRMRGGLPVRVKERA